MCWQNIHHSSYILESLPFVLCTYFAQFSQLDQNCNFHRKKEKKKELCTPCDNIITHHLDKPHFIFNNSYLLKICNFLPKWPTYTLFESRLLSNDKPVHRIFGPYKCHHAWTPSWSTESSFDYEAKTIKTLLWQLTSLYRPLHIRFIRVLCLELWRSNFTFFTLQMHVIIQYWQAFFE